MAMPTISKKSQDAGPVTPPNASAPSLLIACTSIFGISLVYLYVRGTIPDTSWLLTVLDRIHSGDQLYVDIIESNPPFSIWLYMPPHFAAELFRISPEVAVHIYTFFICLASAAISCWMIIAARLADRSWIGFIFPALLLLFVLFPGNAYTERDQIGAALALPLFVIASWRANVTAAAKPKFQHWMLAGLCGSILPMVKPHYAIVWITVGCWIAYKRRSPRMMLLPEFILVSAVYAVYLVSIFFAYPAYFETTLPLLRELYMPFGLPASTLLIAGYPLFVLTLTNLIIRNTGSSNELPTILFIGSLSAWIPFFAQGKGWPYHAYAAILFGSLALLFAIFRRIRDTRQSRTSHITTRFAVILAFAAILVSHARFVGTATPSKDFSDLIKQSAPKRPTVGIIGADIAVSHPLTRMIGGRWIEPYSGDWYVLYSMRAAQKAMQADDAASAQRYNNIASNYVSRKKERFLASLPDVILLDRSSGTAQFVLQSGFSEIVTMHYGVIGAADRIVALGRK